MIWFVSLISYLAVSILAAVIVNMQLEGNEPERFRVRHLLGILFWPFTAVYLVSQIISRKLGAK